MDIEIQIFFDGRRFQMVTTTKGLLSQSNLRLGKGVYVQARKNDFQLLSEAQRCMKLIILQEPTGDLTV